MPNFRRSYLCALILVLVLVGGCESRPVSPCTAKIVPGSLSQDLILKNAAPHDLNRVSITLTVYDEQNMTTYTRHWADWPAGSEKTVSLPVGATPLQRVVLTGTAQQAETRHRKTARNSWSTSP